MCLGWGPERLVSYEHHSLQVRDLYELNTVHVWRDYRFGRFLLRRRGGVRLLVWDLRRLLDESDHVGCWEQRRARVFPGLGFLAIVMLGLVA